MSNNTILDVKMLLLTLLSLLIFFTAMPEDVSATAGWWNSSWNQRINITIDHTKVNRTQTNFPVLINISDSNLTKAQDNGNDIVFINSTDNIKLDHEIEHFNSTTGWLVAWVRIPTLSNTTNTTLGMYYNNSGASNQQNLQAVWDDDYVMVQHLQEIPANDVAGHYDSTTNSNDGTPKNFDGTAASTTNGTGQIDGADVFDGTDDYVSIADVDNLSFSGSFTVSALVNLTSKTDDMQIVFKGENNDANTEYILLYRLTPDRFRFYTGNGIGISYVEANNFGSPSLNTCYHITGVYDSSTDSSKIYIDDVTPDVANSVLNGHNDEIGLGIGRTLSGTSKPFNGTIDEIRISNTTRSASWIRTEYNNQYTPSTFYTHTDEETYTEDPIPYLEVNLITPFDNTIVSQNKTFVVNATIYCRAADCGNVNGTVRYNKTSQTPDEPVSDITGDTPFYIISNINTINCTSNPLTEDEYCNLSWTLNATGALSERYELDVLLESNATSSNNTDDSTLKIDLALIIGLEFTEINFGILDPGSVNQPADNNANGYNVSVDINSDDVENLWVRGTNLTNDNSDTLDCTIHDQYNQYEGNTTNHPCMIDVGNVMWSLESNPAPANKYNLTGTYERVNKDHHTIYAGDYETTYYWINVPYGIYAGPYTGTITFMANATW